MTDAATDGALMNKTHDKAYELLEKMASKTTNDPQKDLYQKELMVFMRLMLLLRYWPQVATLSK